jgi:hypothetical protein
LFIFLQFWSAIVNFCYSRCQRLRGFITAFSLVPIETFRNSSSKEIAVTQTANQSPNKSLKLARVARWTVSTGAASQFIAGFNCRLALR